uniref:Saposin B-type domain-containing protein n=1 Tax=Ascaris lumbricoides TaxID=6252 RepID=A0A0M3IMX2_ASCLU
MHELLMKESLSKCEGIEYGYLVTCIERNMHDLLKTHRKMAIVGEVCCSTNKSATRWCKTACESAMYAPTLEIAERLKRIEYFCDNGIQMDSVCLFIILFCLNLDIP